MAVKRENDVSASNAKKKSDASEASDILYYIMAYALKVMWWKSFDKHCYVLRLLNSFQKTPIYSAASLHDLFHWLSLT